MKIQPTQDNLVVKVDKIQTKTASGFILKETDAKHSTTGTVIAVGPGKILESGDVVTAEYDAGDRVLFPPSLGMEIGDDVRIMKFHDILAVITEGED